MNHDPAATGRASHPLRWWPPSRLLIAVALLLLGASPARAWGPLIHQRVTSEAIETLPKGLTAVLQGAPAGDAIPGPRRSAPEDESTDRRFTLDRFLPFPFRGHPAHRGRPEGEIRRRRGQGRTPALADPGVATRASWRPTARGQGKDPHGVGHPGRLRGRPPQPAGPHRQLRRAEDGPARPLGALLDQALRGHGQEAQLLGAGPRASSTTPRGTSSP